MAVLLLGAVPGFAQRQPFGPGSMEVIKATYRDKPFLLGFWSLSCAHCRADLELFGRLRKAYPALPVTRVATDPPQDGAAVAALLEKYRLGDAPSWQFADEFVERLNFEVDPKWRGERPRTYFYDGAHRVRAVSGKLDELETGNWVKSQLGR